MRKSHPIKEKKVEELLKKMRESYSFVTLGYSSLGSKSSEWLRKEVKKNDGEMYMVSNNVLRRSLNSFSSEKQDFKIFGQNLILFVKSEKIAPLKLFSDLSRKYSLLKLGVVFCDSQFLNTEQKDYISSWSERDIALAKFAYLLNYPILSLIFRLKWISENIS